MMGENPFLSDPNMNKVRKALVRARLPRGAGHLPDRDRRVRRRDPAGLLVHGEGRHLHEHRPPRAARPEGARRLPARRGWTGRSCRRWRSAWASTGTTARRARCSTRWRSSRTGYGTLSYDNLGPSGKLYPNPDPEHSDGTIVLFTERFNTEDGLAHIVPAEWLPPKELPDDEFPFVLNTGPAARALAHRLDDPPLVRARRDRAARGGLPAPRRRRQPRARGRRHGARELAARLDRAGREHLPPRGARERVHPVPLPRGGGEPAHDRRHRPDGEDPRVQVLRSARSSRPGRCASRDRPA